MGGSMSSIVVSGDTSGAVTLAVPAVAGTNTVTIAAQTGTLNAAGPAFSAYQSTSQTGTSGVATKVTLDVEAFDTNNNFASSRFTPTVAGYYQINGKARLNGTGLTDSTVSIFKNGSQLILGTYTATGLAFSVVSTVVYLNGSTDYVELYANGTTSVGSPSYQYISVGNNCEMSGCLVRGA
jgi:hypothetical protein